MTVDNSGKPEPAWGFNVIEIASGNVYEIRNWPDGESVSFTKDEVLALWAHIRDHFGLSTAPNYLDSW